MPTEAKITLVDPQSLSVFDLKGDAMIFSPYQCFSMRDVESEKLVLSKISNLLKSLEVPVYLYKMNNFSKRIIAASGDTSFFSGIIDEKSTEATYNGIKIHQSFNNISEDSLIFICETRNSYIWDLEKKVPNHFNILSPHIAKMFPAVIPEYSWIPKEETIYPINLPDIIFKPNLDLLLLDLPGRNGVQFPVGFSYVIKALKRTKTNFQAFDCSIVNFHRFHIHQFMDLGHEPILPNGNVISNGIHFYGSHLLQDPRHWPFLLEYFDEEFQEIREAIIAAKPKILGLSIHARNEWFSRAMAIAVKAALPETLILVGGHSCYTREMGVSAFPEYDYMVVGEADLVVGPLVEALARGERPANLPGVVSVYDDPTIPFLSGPLAHNLDMLGGLDYDLYPNLNELYQTYNGLADTAIPLTRGCVWSRCSFCAERFAFRTRSYKSYVDEIEYYINSGRMPAFYSSDSDFGGNPNVIYDVCKEISRRNLHPSLMGQVRINKNYDLNFFKTLKNAGVHTMNFGVDALTDNTLRLQKKGYTVDTVLENYRLCHTAGITTYTNIVIGIPGETDDDIEDVISLIQDNRELFPFIAGMNVCDIFNNSPYWYNPEAHDIYFFGVKEEIYKKYPFGIPQNLWYSLNPFSDKSVRISRMRRLLEGLAEIPGVNVAMNCEANYQNMSGGGGHIDFRAYGQMETVRDIALRPANQSSLMLPKQLPPPPIGRYANHIIIPNGDDQSVAIGSSAALRETLESNNIHFWYRPRKYK